VVRLSTKQIRVSVLRGRPPLFPFFLVVSGRQLALPDGSIFRGQQAAGEHSTSSLVIWPPIQSSTLQLSPPLHLPGAGDRLALHLRTA
jgi:hypothetical protein